MDYTDIELDENAVRMIKLRIMKLETDNAKTKEKNDKKILDEITKVIEEEVKCSLKN